MNLTRLMALGTLARCGPTHGHQIRRFVDVCNAGEWSGVSPGALYRELRLMEGEGLVEALRTEQVGRRPARTVYAITADGRLELGALRVQAVRDMDHGPDPLGVALTFAFEGADREELRDLLRARRDRWVIGARELDNVRERGLAGGYLTPVEAAVMRRGVLHAEAEAAWHDDFDKLLAALPAGPAVPAGPAGPGEQPEGRAWELSRRAGWRARSPAGSARSRRSAG